MKKNIKILSLCLGFIFLGSLSCAWAATYVRVAIIQDTDSLRLNIKGYYKIIDLKTNKVLNFGKSINAVVAVVDEGILVKDLIYKSNKLLIDAVDPESVVINDRKFRGNIQIIKKGNRRLLVVNLIELEDYVKGILYHEVSHYWPEEVLYAQAIVSRTYALNQIEQSRNKDFDVTSDIYSQVYGGKTSERYRTNKAVEDTRGKILTYNSEVFPTYFHATCAGHTQDAKLLWNIDIPPLRGVVCNYCQGSPHFSWHYDLSLKEIKAILVKNGFPDCGNITGITVFSKDPSGRVTDLLIKADNKDFKLPAKDFRIFIGPNLIRSTNFSLEIEDQSAIFSGIGWGHGVGMCQWGAYFMAKTGHNYQSILGYYYPKSKLSSIQDK